MDSDSGLPQSPSVEEDDCQELDATPRTHGGPAVENCSIPEGGSQGEASERIDVEALAREVELLLSQTKKQREVRREEDDQFEYAAEHRLLSGEHSPESPEEPDRERRPERMSGSSFRDKGDTRPRSLLDYQQYWRVGSERTRQSKTADKYRLSFVELSDSSEGEEEDVHKNSSYHALPAVKRTPVLPQTERSDITSSKGQRQSLPVELLSTHDSSLEQLADMQYDDEEMDTLVPPGALDNAGLRLSSSLIPKWSLPNVRETTVAIPSRQSNRHYPLQGSTLMYDDEDLDFLLPSAEDLRTGATTIPQPYTPSVSSESPKKTLSTLSYHSSQQSSVVTTKQNSIASRGTSSCDSGGIGNATPSRMAPVRVVPTQRGIPTLDHSSSPLHKMSTAQLQYMVQLLEAKLQGTCYKCYTSLYGATQELVQLFCLLQLQPTLHYAFLQ